jgi:hypothetical protein
MTDLQLTISRRSPAHLLFFLESCLTQPAPMRHRDRVESRRHHSVKTAVLGSSLAASATLRFGEGWSTGSSRPLTSGPRKIAKPVIRSGNGSRSVLKSANECFKADIAGRDNASNSAQDTPAPRGVAGSCRASTRRATAQRCRDQRNPAISLASDCLSRMASASVRAFFVFCGLFLPRKQA